MSPLKLLGWAAGLLTLAFPAAAGVLLAWLIALAGLLLGHLTVVCATAAAVLLVRAVRGLRHRPSARTARRLLEQVAARVGDLNSTTSA